MASTRKRETKSGKVCYEITVSRGRGKAPLTMRWHPPEGWSAKSIARELAKVAADFERRCKAGEVESRAEQREREAAARAEAAKILTLRQYCERVYMPTKTVSISENSRSSFQGNLDHWIYPALGELKLPEVTPSEITALLVLMQSQGKAHSTVVKVYTILRSVFKMAYMTDIVSRNPMDKVERPKPRKDEARGSTVEAYTVDELRYILECLEQEPLKWRAMLRLLIDTGMRRGECVALRWKDVDFAAGTVTIAGNLCYTPRKGVYRDTPKNGKMRTVDVDEEIMTLLRELREEQAANTILSSSVFTQAGSAEPMHPQSVARYMTKFAKRYGIEKLHPHKLRHSFASLAITSGADVASVSEKLGHSDKAVTLRMYTHASEESMRRASNIFRNALKGEAKAAGQG